LELQIAVGDEIGRRVEDRDATRANERARLDLDRTAHTGRRGSGNGGVGIRRREAEKRRVALEHERRSAGGVYGSAAHDSPGPYRELIGGNERQIRCRERGAAVQRDLPREHVEHGGCRGGLSSATEQQGFGA
jgi:hypothetical protein